MIQENDSKELKSKATKGSLADFAEKEADRIERQQLGYLLAMGVVILVTVVITVVSDSMKKGWLLLPVEGVLAFLYVQAEGKVKLLRGRSATYKKLKTIHPKRDSYR